MPTHIFSPISIAWAEPDNDTVQNEPAPFCDFKKFTNNEETAIDDGMNSASDTVSYLPTGNQAWGIKEYMIALTTARAVVDSIRRSNPASPCSCCGEIDRCLPRSECFATI